MDLPTYTSIWRIEKRLYKLYDFRLPMPVPVGQIAVFAAITVPYVILLTILGLPFNHTLFWLYVLPPGVITWLATRPVLESKRLPELVISQVRYLGEPGTWVRMAPLAEKDDVVVIGKVWRRDEKPSRIAAGAPALTPAARRSDPARVRQAAARKAAAAQAASGRPAVQVPTAAPRLPRNAESPGRPGPWPVTGPGAAAVSAAVSAAAADTAPGDSARHERQPPVRPAAGPAGRQAARTGFPASAPGPAVGDEERRRQARPPAAPPAARPAAASWPVKDPHTPPSLLPGASAGPAWSPPVPPAPVPAPVPPAYGDPVIPPDPPQPRGATSVPAAGDAVPAMGDPVPAAGDPIPAGPDSPVDQADSVTGPSGAAPDLVTPAPSLGPIVSVPAQAPSAEPVAGSSAGPAGFFIGPVRPGQAGERPAPREPHDERPAPAGAPEHEAGASEHEAGASEHETAPAKAAQEETPDPAGSEPGAVEAGTAGATVAGHEPAEPDSAAHETAGPEPGQPEEAGPEGQAPTQPGPPDEVPPDVSRPEDGAASEAAPGEAPAGAVGPAPAAPSPSFTPVVVVKGTSGTRPTMVERALSGPGQHRAGGTWREHVRVVPGGHGPGRPDMERRDRDRVLLPIRGPRLIVMLGCTVGAGQTVTTLMLADVLASLRGEPVAALDLNPGQTSLTDMARTSPAGTARDLLTGATASVPGPRGGGRLDLIAHDSAPDGGPALADDEYARVLEILASRYPLTLTDPGASAVARVLSAADQLVLVAPASSDAARAVAMTMEWLDGHGYGELCTGAVTVINGVSKRSMPHVEQAELVVRGRCRAIVRVPWDDLLGAPPAEQGISDAAAGAESRFAQLRPPVQLAYTALAGVLVSALAVGESRMARPLRRTP